MSMRIQIKQSCFVKPAEDTPKKSLWISDLDLLVERTHFPTVYFYKPNNNDVSSNFFEAQVLKEALSKALVLFYPVAGRLGINENGRIEIQCNGEGVLFVEAETDFAIDDFKDFTPRLEFQKLVPNPAVDHSSNISSHPLLVLQVLPNTPFTGKYTYFKCEGTALGVGLHHTLADGVSALHFINTWASIARGDTTITPPFFDRTLLKAHIPPSPKFHHIEYDPPPFLKIPTSPSEFENISTATFDITREQLNTLKAKSKKDDETANFTTYEALAAHIWRCVSKARCLPDDQPTKLYIATDGRFRINPKLPLGYFGNALFTATPVTLSGDLQSEPLPSTVKRIQKALKQMTDEYLKSALDYLEVQSDLTSLVRGASTFRSPNLNINNWRRLPLYDADFGWGRPIFMGPAVVVYEGTIYMLASPNNDGGLLLIVRLEADHMQLFEKFLYELQ
ncbi:shikimate O-hydroxycinnamoyltransferase-like [Citrus sinensis]|nr:shikimate O-hydroxycinnamoyltransferase-like [Citrus sinensis]